MTNVSDLTNYKLMTSTSCDSGLTINIYQDAVERDKVNLVMLSISSEPYEVMQRVTLAEALEKQNDQIKADLFLE